MNQQDNEERKTLQKNQRRQKKKHPSMKMSGKSLKRSVQPKKKT